jgi:DNA-directed RNA polymerase specialized sigma24 family protein
LTPRPPVNYGCSVVSTTVTSPDDTGDGLAAVVALRRLADRLEDAQVERALREGWSWSEVAEALGVTRQAVHKKHARRLAGAGLAPGRRGG